jgi:hypothetical protein
VRFSSLLKLTLAALCLSVPSAVFADYTYQETTQVTGGSLLSMMKMAGAFSSQAKKAGDPVVSTVYIKGNRMAKVTPDSIEIIDLDKETITHIDPLKKAYTVVTFQQMREQWEEAKRKMAQNQAQHPAAPAADPGQDDVKTSFDVKVRKTGVEKQVSGLSAREAILTMTMKATDQKTQQSGSMAVTNDMWMVPEIPGYGEVRDFQKRMAAKLALNMEGSGMDFSKMLAQKPGATEAMADMGKEMQKLDGVPVKQIMRMGTTTNGQPLPAASEAPLPPDNSPAMPSAGDVAKQSAVSALTSRFGIGFGKKKQDPPPPAQNADSSAPPAAAVLMESETTTSNFSNDPVDPSHFEVPAGYKQVANPGMNGK